MNVILRVMAVMGIASADCFSDNQLQYVYSLPDFTGNYSNIREFWLKKDTTCEILAKYDSKITWYSSDISLDYQMYY